MLKHKGTKTIDSKKLILRKFTLSDAKAMFENWANDSEVTKYLTWPTHKNISVSKSILMDLIKQYSEDDYYQWAIEMKEDKKVIGSIGAMNISNINENCEIGYCIGREFWGKGITTEALNTVIEFLFNEVGFERISAIHYSENVASGKVMLKSGMKYEGKKRNFHKGKNGEFIDCELYSILKGEHLKNI